MRFKPACAPLATLTERAILQEMTQSAGYWRLSIARDLAVQRSFSRSRSTRELALAPTRTFKFKLKTLRGGQPAQF